MISVDDLGSPTWDFQRTHYWTHKIQDGGDLRGPNDRIGESVQ